MSNHLRFRRRKLWVDGRIQGAIVVRLLTYYLACGITATCMLVAWRVAVHGTQGGLQQHLTSLWSQLGPGALSLVLLLPMVLFDSVRLSHRFTGPMVRIRKTLQEAAAGDKVRQLKLRETDHWQDLANDVNKLLERYGALKQSTADEDKDLEATLNSALESVQAAGQAAQQLQQETGDQVAGHKELETARG